MSELKAKALHMGPAQCAVDLGDGSERGEYVNQDYILQKLGLRKNKLMIIQIRKLWKQFFPILSLFKSVLFRHAAGMLCG